MNAQALATQRQGYRHQWMTRSLTARTPPTVRTPPTAGTPPPTPYRRRASDATDCCQCSARAAWARCGGRATRRRSEEHTSELQSRRDLVCRLLLEKKKKNEKRN